MTQRRLWRSKTALGGLALVVIVALVVAFWNWDWFIPLIDSRASKMLGRNVTIKHLHVALGSTTSVTADGLEISSPSGFDRDLLETDRLTIGIRPMALIHGRTVIPQITIDHPRANLLAHADGSNNWSFPAFSSAPPTGPKRPPPSIGTLSVRDGEIHVDDPKVRAIFDIAVHTAPGGTAQAGGASHAGSAGRDARDEVIIADATGTYAGQPISGHFVGGSILSVQSKSKPYPVDLDIHNGATSVALHGSIADPLAFGGANLSLEFQGPDMGTLLPLTGIPIPQTPPYRLVGKLDYRHDRVQFHDFAGTMGKSDLEGTITVLPGRRPDVTADLTSRYVDLRDLSGFFGGTPPAEAPAQSAAVPAQAAAKTDGTILPDKRVDLPRLNQADIHLRYDGAHIEGKHVPLDDIVVRVDVVNSAIAIHKLDFKVGSGRLAGHGEISPSNGALAADYDLEFQDIDLSRVLRATGAFHGQGIISGRATIKTTGNSIAGMAASGNGGLTLVMTGGNVSALLSDIAGLEFGNALLSALGLPAQADVQCFVADLPLHQGVIDTRTLLLQTAEARTVGTGTIDLRNQSLDYAVTTRSTHFSVGSLPGPVDISGKLGAPSIRPGAEVVARAGAATALGVLFAPLAILPTIQLGVGQTEACHKALAEIDTHPAVSIRNSRRHHVRPIPHSAGAMPAAGAPAGENR